MTHNVIPKKDKNGNRGSLPHGNGGSLPLHLLPSMFGVKCSESMFGIECIESLHDLIMTMFHRKGDDIINAIKLFFMSSPDLNKKHLSTGSTPMHYIMILLKEKQRQQVDMIPYFKLLLECIQSGGDMEIENKSLVRPIDIFHDIMNVVDSMGNTLLFHFVINKQYDIAMLAVEYGVDVSRLNNESKTIFDYAMHYATSDFDNIEHARFIEFIDYYASSNNRRIKLSSIKRFNLMDIVIKEDDKMDLSLPEK